MLLMVITLKSVTEYYCDLFNLYDLFNHLYLEETHITQHHLYTKEIHIDTTLNIYIYIYIYIKEIREAHTDTATYILCHIYYTVYSTHRHYNINRSYINIHKNTRLEFNYLFTVLSK